VVVGVDHDEGAGPTNIWVVAQHKAADSVLLPSPLWTTVATTERFLSVHVGKIVCAQLDGLGEAFFTFWVIDPSRKVIEAKQFSPPMLFRQQAYAWAGFTYWLQVGRGCFSRLFFFSFCSLAMSVLTIQNVNLVLPAFADAV